MNCKQEVTGLDSHRLAGGLFWGSDHLRVEGERLGEPERVWVVLVVISKLLTLKANGRK